MKRVVVTGLGCITPIGNTVAAFRDSLYAGRSGIAPFDPAFPGALSPDPGLRFRTIARVKDFDPTQNPAHHLTSAVLLSTESGAQFAIIAARQAAAESQLLQHHNPTEIAIVTGCACGGRSVDEEAARHLYTRNARVPPMTIVRTMSSAGASSIAADLGIRGPVLNLATACASGTHAIGLAFHMVRAGIAPAAIAGGYEAPLTFGFLRAWDSMRVVSPTSCRPFSADRDGMTLGEGAAMLVLEPLDSALARRAPIYAEIVGFGMSADAHHVTQPHPEGAAQAIRRALLDITTPPEQDRIPQEDGVPHPSQFHRDGWDVSSPAGAPSQTASPSEVGMRKIPQIPGAPSQTASPSEVGMQDIPPLARQIGYINAHGTGTPTNDAVEAAAIHQALGHHAPTIPISATKSLTGHSIAATGAIEALATILALADATLPHTAGVTHPDPTLNLDIITHHPRPLPPGKDLALSNSLAFGGLNAVLALRRYP